MMSVTMLEGVRNWFRQHGLIILVLVLGLLGSLILVWWRLDFTLEFFQPEAAVKAPREACTSDAECQHGCSPSGYCNVCPSDQWCRDNRFTDRRACEDVFCVGGGQPFNHCVLDDSACAPDSGGAAPPSGEFTVTVTNWHSSQTCGRAGSDDNGPFRVTLFVSNQTNTDQVITFNAFRSDTAGCGATTDMPAAGATIAKRVWAPGESGTTTAELDQGAHRNCGRVQVDIFKGPSQGIVGDVIDYGVDCTGAEQPPGDTHLECVNNACVSVDGGGTDQCSSSADCGITVETHMACENNACVVKTGVGTDECSVDADCAVPQLACVPASQSVLLGATDADEEANFTATGGSGTYSWTAPSGSPTSGVGGTFSTSYTQTGTYTVTVTSDGQTATCDVTVTEEETTELVCAPTEQTVEVGQVADLTVAGGSGTYEWEALNGDPETGSGGVFGVAYEDPGSYTVTVTDLNTEETDVCAVTVQAEETPPEEEPELDIDKYVITAGGSEVNSRSADPREVIQFVFYVQSNGTEELIDVVVRDAIPAGLTYRSGTARLNGNTVIDDSDFLDEIELGNMDPGDEHAISFEVRVAGESSFDLGSTTLVNTAFADADNAPEVSDTAFVEIEREPEEPTLSIRKFGRNVSRNEVGERTSVTVSPNEVIEFTIRVRNSSDATAEDVHVQDIVPEGVTYQSGSATLNGQPTSDVLVSNGINIGDLDPGQEDVVRFLGRVVPANQLPEGTTTLINVARTWADGIPTMQAELPVIIFNQPVTIPPVETGPGETTVLALIISAIVTLMYVGYTSTATFRRREAKDISEKAHHGDFRG